MGSIIGELAAVLTAASVSIYVLGLIGLAIPLRNITNDVSTAWYVTSLVPRIVVAGQGARIWLRFPLIITFSVILVVVATQLIYPGATAWGVVIVIVVVGVVASGSFPSGRFTQFLGLSVYACGCAILSFAALDLSHLLSNQFAGSPSRTFTWIIFLFLGAFIAGLPLAVTADAPLPDVVITKKVEGAPEGVSESLEGRLVAHSDGFWHLFTADDIHLSIPDDKVLEVQMGELETEEEEP